MLFTKAALFAVVAVAPANSLQAFAKTINEDLPEDAKEPIYTRELKGKSDSGKGPKSGKSGGTCPNAVCDIYRPGYDREGYDSGVYDRDLQSDKQPRSLGYDAYYGRGRYAPPPSPIDVSCCEEFNYKPGIEWACNRLTDDYNAVSQIISGSGLESKMWCCKKECSALEQGNCFIPYETIDPFPGNPLCGGISKGGQGSKSRFGGDDVATKVNEDDLGKPGGSPPEPGGLCNNIPPPPGFLSGPYTEVAIEGLPDCAMRVACCSGGVVGSQGPTPFDLLNINVCQIANPALQLMEFFKDRNCPDDIDEDTPIVDLSGNKTNDGDDDIFADNQEACIYREQRLEMGKILGQMLLDGIALKGMQPSFDNYFKEIGLNKSVLRTEYDYCVVTQEWLNSMNGTCQYDENRDVYESTIECIINSMIEGNLQSDNATIAEGRTFANYSATNCSTLCDEDEFDTDLIGYPTFPSEVAEENNQVDDCSVENPAIRYMELFRDRDCPTWIDEYGTDNSGSCSRRKLGGESSMRALSCGERVTGRSLAADPYDPDPCNLREQRLVVAETINKQLLRGIDMDEDEFTSHFRMLGKIHSLFMTDFEYCQLSQDWLKSLEGTCSFEQNECIYRQTIERIVDTMIEGHNGEGGQHTIMPLIDETFASYTDGTTNCGAFCEDHLELRDIVNITCGNV